MPRRSVIDEHPERDAIIEALRNGTERQSEIAKRYGINKVAVSRYAKKVAARDYARSPAAEEQQQSIERVPQPDPETEVGEHDLIAKLERLAADAMRIQRRTEDEKPQVAISALREQRSTIETLLKVAAEVREQRRDDISRHPEFIRYQRAVSQVLREFPGALERLEEVLAE